MVTGFDFVTKCLHGRGGRDQQGVDTMRGEFHRNGLSQSAAGTRDDCHWGRLGIVFSATHQSKTTGIVFQMLFL